MAGPVPHSARVTPGVPVRAGPGAAAAAPPGATPRSKRTAILSSQTSKQVKNASLRPPTSRCDDRLGDSLSRCAAAPRLDHGGEDGHVRQELMAPLGRGPR